MLHKLDAGEEHMVKAVSFLSAYASAIHGLEALAGVALSNGAIHYVVVETPEEVMFLQRQFGLDPGQVITPSNSLVCERVGDLTNGHGADVVFSAGTVGPAAAREAWRSIAGLRRFVDGGRKDALSRIEAGSCSWIRAVRQHRGARQGSREHADTFGAAMSVLQYKTLKAPVLPTLPARTALRFSSDARYLLMGCLGGLGRGLTSWMMNSGARCFTFLSRSGSDVGMAAKLASDIEAARAIVQVVRGDATSKADVLAPSSGFQPSIPIKVYPHARFQDDLFRSMTFENWKTAIRPRVLGARNLHSVLAGAELDIFIMTSSVSGILGTSRQSTYAAANSYLDSLARQRRAAGLAATSVILPMVLGVGVVAKNTELEEPPSLRHACGRVPDHIVVGLDPVMLQKGASDAGETSGSPWLEDARFSNVVHDMMSSEDAAAGGTGASASILKTVNATETPAEAAAAVMEHFIGKLARLLMLNPEDFESSGKSIAAYGIDSMIGAKLRNWIFKEYRIDIPFQQLLVPTLTLRNSLRRCDDYRFVLKT
ncbi:hypothetical protein DL770_003380 [Monosporascus sp. CRB-9-2]|nr:hypothetical protein DL770_003380 [Monosporascus sp. CRB-9-2]